ncbi:MAG TPA: hypothetical protein VH375_07575 [Rhodanobacteraceae bacterium]
MTDPRARLPLRQRLAERLPEILIEAASVVAALLLALALNGWNEEREIRARADSARAAILAELRGNREEIRTAQPKLKEIVQYLSDLIANGAPAGHEMHVDLGISLLSEAAWRAALATQATQTIDFAWMTRVARVYELQENYLRVQNAAIEQLGSIPADSSVGGKQVAASLVPRLSTLSQLADGLARNYDELLDARPP